VPAHTSLAQAQHVGTAWMLFSTDSKNLAKVAFSNDNGGRCRRSKDAVHRWKAPTDWRTHESGATF
jgi:hypothetical protein